MSLLSLWLWDRICVCCPNWRIFCCVAWSAATPGVVYVCWLCESVQYNDIPFQWFVFDPRNKSFFTAFIRLFIDQLLCEVINIIVVVSCLPLQFIDLRLAVLGNVDAGKSTVLGVLTQGELDNGRGRARLNLFRHLHEIQSGRTSSISHEILGFNSKGEVGWNQ